MHCSRFRRWLPVFLFACLSLPSRSRASADGVWSQIPGGPGVRIGASVIHDSARNRLIAFGGSGPGGFANDVWELQLGANPSWSSLSPTGLTPPGRRDHIAYYDAAGDRMWMHGGRDGDGPLGDARSLTLGETPAWNYEFVNPDWPTLTSPENIYGHCLIPFGGVMRFSWGSTGCSEEIKGWELQISGAPEWDYLNGFPPPTDARAFSQAVAGSQSSFYVIGGAYDLCGTPTETDQICSGFSLLSTTGSPLCVRPFTGVTYGVAYDPLRDRILLYGTTCNPGMRVYSLDLPTATWSELHPAGNPPPAGIEHRVIMDAAGDRLIVLGGTTGETWALSFSATSAASDPSEPALPRLRPAEPNPSAGPVLIQFDLAAEAPVRLDVYDVGGRLVRELVEETRPAGHTSITWDGRNDQGSRRAGLYFYVLSGPDWSRTGKLVLTE